MPKLGPLGFQSVQEGQQNIVQYPLLIGAEGGSLAEARVCDDCHEGLEIVENVGNCVGCIGILRQR